MKSMRGFACMFVCLFFLFHSVFSQLGIAGPQSNICSSSCNIAAECDAQCLNQPTGDPYISCLCQESCVDFMGVCNSCCNGTASDYPAYQDPFCGSNIDRNLQTCNFYGNVAPNANASLFDSISFVSTSSLPSSAATWVSMLPSPTLVSLDVSNAQVTESTTVPAPYTTWGGPPKFSTLSSAATSATANPTGSTSAEMPTATQTASSAEKSIVMKFDVHLLRLVASFMAALAVIP